MENMQISCREEISYAHRLLGHRGKCGNIHGHTGVVTVTISGKFKDSMVLDYNTIKDVIRLLDHKFLVWYKDKYLTRLGDIKCMPFQTTSENLARYYGRIFRRMIPEAEIIISFKETSKTEAEYSYIPGEW